MKYTRNRCERSEQQPRAERVVSSGIHKQAERFKHLRTIRDPGRIHQEIVRYQFKEVFQPSWFGTVQWQPFITDYTSVIKEAKHFNNKFFCALLNTKPKRIPMPAERPRIIWFHERVPVQINPHDPKNPRFKLAYHSHFHLEECPAPYSSHIRLDWFIRKEVGNGFHHFSTNNSTANKGFVLEPWVEERHSNYNFKDYYRYKHQQDADLVLDLKNSDLQF